MHLNLVIHNPIVIHFSQWPQRSCHRFLFFLGSGSFSAFYLVVHQPCFALTDTCLQPYNPFLFFIELALGRTNIHKTFACRHLLNNTCTVVEEWTHGYFCLGYFSSSTQFDLVLRLPQKAWRQCVLDLCARSWAS